MDLRNKTIVITGGRGFLGTHVCNKFRKQGLSVEGDEAYDSYPHVLTPRSKEFDLTTEIGVKTLYEELSPDIVIHLAAVVGGI